MDLPPFLKWAGGKRWFVQKHADLLPKAFDRYIEPFLGGGSVYFHLRPTRAVLGDTNPELIAAYQGIQKNWKGVMRSLQYHDRQHSDDYYYLVRGKRPTQAVPRASRMIYLNRTCFNGIHRVNLKGDFNVPRGTRDTVIFDTDRFDEMSMLLSTADIRLSDFESLIDEARKGDFVFADPPYTVRHNFNGFVRYNETLFSWLDQERLAKALIRARTRGVSIVSTNANHSSVRNLYAGNGFRLITTSRFSSISANSEYRSQFDELIVISLPNSPRR